MIESTHWFICCNSGAKNQQFLKETVDSRLFTIKLNKKSDYELRVE